MIQKLPENECKHTLNDTKTGEKLQGISRIFNPNAEKEEKVSKNPPLFLQICLQIRAF